MCNEEKVTEKKYRDCESCHNQFLEEELTYDADPFASEIYDDETPCWMCDECITISSEEI
jgi:hypothetical protein